MLDILDHINLRMMLIPKSPCSNVLVISLGIWILEYETHEPVCIQI